MDLAAAAKEAAGRRWRQLFIADAANDPAAVSTASKRLGLPGTDISIRAGRDSRPDSQRIAERFLHGEGIADWETEAEPAGEVEIKRTALVFCPGLVNTLLPVRAFGSAFPAVADRFGWRILCAEGHPLRGCEANVEDLAATIEQGLGLDAGCRRIEPADADPPEEVVLFGYSKGTADALTLLVARPDLAERVRAIVCWGGAVGGSFLADDMYEAIAERELSLGGVIERFAALIKVLFPVLRLERISERIDGSDPKAAVRDLTTAERERFTAEHGAAIDALGIPIFSVAGVSSALEVPAFQAQGFIQIQRRAGENDMQVSLEQARWPGSAGVDLANVHAHHWDMSYDPFPLQSRAGFSNLDHPFPREAAIVATMQLLGELGVAR